MANKIITVYCADETIQKSSSVAGAAGSSNAVTLRLSFSTAWDGTTKKVYFYDATKAKSACIICTVDKLVSGETDVYDIPIPAEALDVSGKLLLTVKGVVVSGTTVERCMVSATTTMDVLPADMPSTDTAPVEPTPTQAEQLLASVNSVTGMTASATNLSTGQPATVTKTTNGNGTINLAFGLPAGGKGDTGIQGVKGDKGDTGNSVEYVWNGTQFGIRIEGQVDYVYVDLKGATGATGAKGDKGDVGLTGVKGDAGATGAKGDTGNTGATGNGIASVARTSGTGAAGTTDTYTITFTDSTTTTFGVYNGADGSGAGDMVKATYDTNNSGVVDNAEKVNGLTVLTAVPSGAVFTDTIYTHPANHPPSIITQDASNRFVTDTEKAEWNGKANPPTAVTATLSTTWEGSGPYTQSVTVSGVTSTNNITVSLASTADEAQRNAARDALLSATAQATNSITVTADGDKPIIALPIQVLILGG